MKSGLVPHPESGSPFMQNPLPPCGWAGDAGQEKAVRPVRALRSVGAATAPTHQPLRATLPVVELIGTTDPRGRPCRAVVIGVDNAKRRVKIAPIISLPGEKKEMFLDFAYVREVGAVPIH